VKSRKALSEVAFALNEPPPPAEANKVARLNSIARHAPLPPEEERISRPQSLEAEGRSTPMAYRVPGWARNTVATALSAGPAWHRLMQHSQSRAQRHKLLLPVPLTAVVGDLSHKHP
jgi:hypothetical protein